MTRVFDTGPLMAYFQGEPGGQHVARLLDEAAEGRERGAVSRVTLAEVGYLLGRRDPKAARHSLRNLVGEYLEPVACEPVWEDAARIKAAHAPLSLADAFAVATARALAAELVVKGDDGMVRACAAERVRVKKIHG